MPPLLRELMEVMLRSLMSVLLHSITEWGHAWSRFGGMPGEAQGGCLTVSKACCTSSMVSAMSPVSFHRTFSTAA